MNSCLNLIFSKNNIRIDKTLYRDILEILKFDPKKENIDIPIILKNKIDCLARICTMKMEDKTDDNIIDSLSFSEKFSNILSLIEIRRGEELKDQLALDNIKQIKLRKKFKYLLQNYGKFNSVVDKVRDSSFESIDDLIIEYENTIKLLYSNIIEQSRIAAVEATSSLDLIKDNYSHVISKIIEKYDRKNTTPTGFSILDDYVFNGGFERSRLYIFAGSAGSAKSTLLTNLIINSARVSPFLYNQENPNPVKDGIKKVYIYITLENTIEEAFMRIYQAIFNKTTIQILNDITSGVNIEKILMEEFKRNESTIIMKYFKPKIMSCTDLMVVIDDAISEYGQESIKGLYLDFLDNLKNDVRYDVRWMEIGEIALSLKMLAVDYNIPVITVTHLDRSSYNPENFKRMNLSQVAKSIEKVENADCVCLQSLDQFDPTTVYMNFAKNRSGKSFVSVNFKVNLSHFKFIHGFKMTDENKIMDPAEFTQDFDISGSNAF